MAEFGGDAKVGFDAEVLKGGKEPLPKKRWKVWLYRPRWNPKTTRFDTVQKAVGEVTSETQAGAMQSVRKKVTNQPFRLELM